MKRVWFIRHGQTDWNGRGLAGRTPGVPLNAEGRRQARAIVERLRGVRLAAIYSSPQARALETAAPLSDEQDVPVQIHHDLDEIDFGIWTGRSFAELADDPLWRKWNEERATAEVPEGETMVQVQRRILQAVDELAGAQPIALVSHGDVIRAALLSFLGLSLNEVHTLSFEPGMIAFVEYDERAATRVVLSDVRDAPAFAQSSGL